MRIYDVSQPLSGSTAVWPGDQPFVLDWTLLQDRGDSVNVASVLMSVHTGTHVDAGYHVATPGTRAGELALERFIGPATVVDALDCDVLDERLLERFDAAAAPRVLFHTRREIDAREFPEHFATPTAAFARKLLEAGVVLVGTDAPSIDPFDSKTLGTHHILMNAGIAILENLVLTEVPAGRYTLIALPLKLMDADGSPVRAVLLDP